MSETLIQQALNWEDAVVFIPLAFGLAVGLGYAIFQQPDIRGEPKVLLSSPLRPPEQQQQLVLEDI
jgi:hypothetical protein